MHTVAWRSPFLKVNTSMGLIACSCFMIVEFDILLQHVTNGFSYVLQAIISPRNLLGNTRKNRGTEHGSRDGNCNYMEV